MIYQDICQKIVKRLQFLLEMDDPLFLRDQYIHASKKKGSDLWNSELEELWLNLIANCFNDEELKALIEIRAAMYLSYAQYGLDIPKVA